MSFCSLCLLGFASVCHPWLFHVMANPVCVCTGLTHPCRCGIRDSCCFLPLLWKSAELDIVTVFKMEKSERTVERRLGVERLNQFMAFFVGKISRSCSSHVMEKKIIVLILPTPLEVVQNTLGSRASFFVRILIFVFENLHVLSVLVL